MNHKILALALCATIGVSGCTQDDPNRRAKIGAGIGAIAGAVIGNNVGGRDTTTRVIGAAVGALAGYAVGNYMDKQYNELKSALEDELRAEYVTITRLDEDTVKLTLSSEASFDVDSSAIKPAFQPALDRVGSVMRKYDKTVVHVIGHTDSTGSEDYNQRLSERRAISVADHLSSRGVDRGRLYASGRGELEPRASNETTEGRRLNRRVDLYINAVVEGRENDAYQSPQYY